MHIKVYFINNKIITMIAYQYKIRKEKELTEAIDFNINDVHLKNTKIVRIKKPIAEKIILEYEWLHSMPFANKYFFGIYFTINNIDYLGGVLVFGTEYSENTGVWDKYGYTDKMLLLSRGVCLWWTPKNTASYFISRACDWIKNNTEYRIITATVDPAAGEIGTIYQSLNWCYVGLMSGNYNKNSIATRFGVIIDGKLRFSRWIRNKLGTMKKEEILKIYPNAIFVPQHRKQRYFYFLGSKTEIKINKSKLKHLFLPYPTRNDNIVGTIYMIVNKTNNKIYIGQTTRSLQQRIREYEKGYGNDYINNSIKKYGFENFTFTIIDTAGTINELNEKEIFYINKYNSTNKEIGYNLELGGKNSIPSPETLIKMSASHSGTIQSEEWINKRIHAKGSDEAKKYGKPKTDKEKEYLSINSPKFWTGKTRSDETKLKISNTKKERGISNKVIENVCKKVYKTDSEGNLFTYISTKEASIVEGVNQSTISRWCTAKRVVNGYKWCY
jgi:group I intron endonuclease